MLKAVIFDMDGVIIDSEPVYKKTERELFEELGIYVSEELHEAYVGTKSCKMWADMKERFGFCQTAEELSLLETERYTEKLLKIDGIGAIDGIVPLLGLLEVSGIKAAIASSSDTEVIGLVTGMLAIDEFFEVKVSGQQVKNSKPEPDIFLLAAALTEVTPEECAVIEDSMNGVTAAKKAGMKCIGFRNPNSGEQDLSMADIVVDNIAEIDIDLLSKLFEGEEGY